MASTSWIASLFRATRSPLLFAVSKRTTSSSPNARWRKSLLPTSVLPANPSGARGQRITKQGHSTVCTARPTQYLFGSETATRGSLWILIRQKSSCGGRISLCASRAGFFRPSAVSPGAANGNPKSGIGATFWWIRIQRLPLMAVALPKRY